MNSRHLLPKINKNNMMIAVDVLESPTIPYEDGKNAADKNLTPG